MDKLFGKKNSAPKQERAEPSIEDVLSLYEEYEHPPPSAKVRETLSEMDPSAALATVRRLCEEIEGARVQRTVLNVEDMLKYGLLNLSEARVAGRFNGVNFQGANFTEAYLTDTDFFNSNLSSAILTNARLTRTKFNNSVLNTTVMPSVNINGEIIDLEKNALSVSRSDFWNIHKTDIGSLGTCSDCEYHNAAVLGVPDHGERDSYARRGVLIFQGGEPLGYMKLKGERSFLALRTVRLPNQEILFFKGMVYTLEYNVTSWLDERSQEHHLKTSAWRRLDLEDFKKESSFGQHIPPIGRNNMRFIREPDMYALMDDLLERIEYGEEPMVDLL